MVLSAVFHRLGAPAAFLLAGLAALFVGPRIFWSAYCGPESGPEAAFWGGVLSFAVGWTLIGAALGGRTAARRGAVRAALAYMAIGLSLATPVALLGEGLGFALQVFLGWPWLVESALGLFGGCFYMG